MGKKERVMIACVTTETFRISEAAKFYDVDRIHLIHYVDENNSKKWFFQSFYDQTVKLIKESLPDTEIVESNSRVFYFDHMLRTVESIVEKENLSKVEPVIYINVSAGSPEYISAATMISMMHDNTEPVSVGAKDYLHNEDEDLKAVYFDGDTPVGLIKSTREPKTVPQFRLDAPKKRLVIGLRILDRRIEKGESVLSKDVVKEFKDSGIWERSAESNDQVYYNRDFIDKWLELKWVQRHPDMHKKLIVTDFGRFVIDTFYLEK